MNTLITQKCCMCGEDIPMPMWAIRDFKGETYWEWVFRHIKRFFLVGKKPRLNPPPVCETCYAILDCWHLEYNHE